MIRITARINIGENGGTLNTVTTANSSVNYSSTLNEVNGHHIQRKSRPFILGRSRLGGGDRFTKTVNYFIGRQKANASGNFTQNFVIELSGSKITLLTIVFNKRDNEFPISILVDGNAFYDDDPTWTIPLDGKDEHVITISNWNTPNSPLIISSIYTDLSIDLNETNLLDFERTIMDRSDIKKPSFGIISNTGRLSFIDKDGEVADYISQQLISSANVISAYLEDTETGAQEQIAYFNTQQWSYNNSRSIVDVSLKDDLEEWQDINVAEIYFNLKSQQSETLKYFYEYLHEKTPKKYNMLSFEELDETTKNILQNTTIQYPYLEKGSLWRQWSKLCEIAQLHIYKKNNQTVCVYSEGN